MFFKETKLETQKFWVPSKPAPGGSQHFQLVSIKTLGDDPQTSAKLHPSAKEVKLNIYKHFYKQVLHMSFTMTVLHNDRHVSFIVLRCASLHSKLIPWLSMLPPFKLRNWWRMPWERKSRRGMQRTKWGNVEASIARIESSCGFSFNPSHS